MTRIYISLGSNIEREHHIRAGLDALQAEFGQLAVSRVFESEAVGFNGRPFYNLVVGADTDLPLATLCQRLRAMEFAHGREPDAKKFAPAPWISICCSMAIWSARRPWYCPAAR